MNTPDSNASTAEIASPVLEKRALRRIGELLAATSPIVAEGDTPAAQALVQEAESEFPGNPALAPAVAKCKALIERSEWFEKSLESMRRDLEEDRFSAAVGHFREALTLSQGLTLFKDLIGKEAQRQAEKLLPQNWRVAETILQEAAAADPQFQPPSTLKTKLLRARDEEVVSNAIYQSDRIGMEGNHQEARRRLGELLIAHPGDKRIAERIHALDHPPDPMRAAEVLETPRPSPVQLEAKETPVDEPHATADPARAKFLIANSAWNSFKNFAVLVATTFMLGLAGVLVWQHFAKHYGKTATLPVAAVHRAPAIHPTASPAVTAVADDTPVAHKTFQPPDEEAWDLVKTSSDAKIIRAFLETYPDSSHVLRARLKLDSLEWEKVDKNRAQDVEAYLRTHPDSHYKADAQHLIAELKAKKPAALGPDSR